MIINRTLYNSLSASGQFFDYTPVNQDIVFDHLSNVLVQCVTIQITDDSILETAEAFEVVVTSSDPEISIRPFGSTIVTISNDDGKICLTALVHSI